MNEQPPTTTRLFAYGTLMEPACLDAVAGGVPPSRPARVQGYRVGWIDGYPGMVPDASHSVDGLVYEGITPAMWEDLDAYEGPLYRHETVMAEEKDGGGIEATAYVVRPEDAGRVVVGT